MTTSVKLALFSLLFIISCKQQNTVEGHIEGLNSDTLFISYQTIPKKMAYKAQYKTEWDTIFTKNNSFTYNSKTPNDAVMMDIYPPGIKRFSGRVLVPRISRINLIIKPGEKVHIEGKRVGHSITYEVEGSKISEDIKKLRETKMTYMLSDLKNRLIIDTLAHTNANPEDIEIVYDKVKANRKLFKEIDSIYVTKNKDKELSAYLLNYYGKLYRDYKSLTPEVQNGIFKPYIDHEIERHQRSEEKKKKEALKLGQKAPYFELLNPNGSYTKLTDVKKDYIILDFWGSWCNPCISEFPAMKTFYEKHKNNIEFVGIACRNSKGKWLEAIKKYDIPWTQLLNGNSKETDISIDYVIKAFPSKILLDKQYNILGIFEGTENDFFTSVEKLLETTK